MEIWLDDIIEQICTANVLMEGKSNSGKRLAMIIIDNAVEFSLKAYVESYKRLVPKVIKRKDWEQKKTNFEDVLNFVLAKSGISINENLMDYHTIRNDLYHGAKPLSVEPKIISRYIKVLKSLLKELFNFEMPEDAWNKNTKSVKDALLGKEIPKRRFEFRKTDEGLVKMTSEKRMGDRPSICLVTEGFISEIGRPPTFDDLEKSLNLSGQGMKKERLTSRISELRKKKYIETGELRLTGKGRKWLIKRKFLQE